MVVNKPRALVKELHPLQIGKSLFDEAGSQKVASLVEKAKKNNVRLVFPVDYVTADKFDKDAKVRAIADFRCFRSPTDISVSS